jgi:uncharacterized protein YhfF
MERHLPIAEFGLTPATKDSCARLVLQAKKRATTALLASYAHDHEPLPRIGQRSVVRDGRGRDIAVIQVSRVDIRRFCDVDAAYAATEGEGDGSLAHWREAHWRYLGAECSRVGLPLREDVAVLLEYFEMVEPLIRLEDF